MAQFRFWGAATIASLVLGVIPNPAIAQVREHFISIEGNVRIRRAGSNQFVTAKSGYAAGGDELRVYGRGKAKIYCRDRAEFLLLTANTAAQKISTKCGSIPVVSRSQLPPFWRGFWDTVRGDSSQSQTGLRSGDSNIPYAIAPRKSMVLTTRPEIRWHLLEGATSYDISLSHPQFETITWTVAAANLSYKYPLDQPELVAGEKYTLKIQTDNFISSTEDGQSVWIEVLGAEEQQEFFGLLQQLRNEDLSEPMAIIVESALYERFELYSQAIAILEGYGRNQGASVVVLQRLAEIYATIGLPREEELQYAKIVQLTTGELSQDRAIALDRLADFAESRNEAQDASKYRTESKRISQQLGY
ncbi:MAG: hypothetical protein WBB82_10870 [Limnothrix sp.]